MLVDEISRKVLDKRGMLELMGGGEAASNGEAPEPPPPPAAKPEGSGRKRQAEAPSAG